MALAASVLAAGCGGGGGGNGGGNNPPPVGEPDVTRVNLPETTTPHGRFTVSYLPRQGRANDVISVEIKDILLQLGAETFQVDLPLPINFVLNGAEVQNQSTLVPILDDDDLRVFDTFVLSLQSATYLVGGTEKHVFFNEEDVTEPLIRESFPAQIKIYRGRESNVDLRLNDASLQFFFDENTGDLLDDSPAFRRDIFEAANLQTGVVQSYLSDYMMFDLSSMPLGLRPVMSSGQTADRVYFSGDRFALSRGSGNGVFEAISPDLTDPIPGVFADPVLIGQSSTPGEYRLLTPDPNDPSDPPAQITALRGMFRPFFDPNRQNISLIIPASDSTFTALIMPTSRGNDVFQILLIAHNSSGKVTNLYFGDADFSANSFVAFPLENVTTGSTQGRIQGTITNYTDKNGTGILIGAPEDSEKVSRGVFTITGTPPTGFPTTGDFIVFR